MGTGREPERRCRQTKDIKTGTGMGAGAKTRAVTEMGTGTRIGTGMGMRAGTGRSKERRRSARDRTRVVGACHYLPNRFQMKAPVAPSRSLREAFKRAPRSLRGACLREGFAEPPRRHHEPFAEVYEPFAEVAHTEGSTKTPWRVHEASSKGPWMNCMFLLDHDCNRVWSILYCF